MQIKYDLPKLPHNIVDQYNQYMKNKKLNTKKQASQLSTLCKMLKVSVGTVVLALPEGFSKVYILGGVLVLIICGILQCYSWYLLVDVIEEKAKVALNQKMQEEKAEIKESKIAEFEMTDANKEEDPQSDQIVDYNDESIVYDEKVDDKEDPLQEKDMENPLTQQIKFERMNMISVMQVLSPNSRVMIIFIEIMTLVLLYGQAVSLIIFFNQSMEAIIPTVTQFEYYIISQAAVLTLIIMSFSFIKSMEKLRFLTNIGSYLVFIVMYFFSSICLYKIKDSSSNNTSPPVYYGINFSEVPFFFGVSLFSYDMNGVLTEIREEMQEPQFFKKNLAQSMIICCIIYVIFGMVGYLAYGVKTNPLITINLDQTISLIGIGVKSAFLSLQMSYALSMLLTVILQNVVSIRLLEDLPYQFGNQVEREKRGYLWRMAIRFLYIGGYVVFFLIFTASYFTNFSDVISLLGNVPSVTLGFIMPYYLHREVFPDQRWYFKLLNLFVLLTGMTGGILGVISVFKKL